MSFDIHVMRESEELFVGTCAGMYCATLGSCCDKRLAVISTIGQHGGGVLVASREDAPLAFIHGMRVEDALWGAQGQELLFLACIVVPAQHARQGMGRSLVHALESLALEQAMKGVVVCAYSDSGGDQVDAYMPIGFFHHLGYETVAVRNTQQLAWKKLEDDAMPPTFLPRAYDYKPINSKVVVDLFAGNLCPPSCLEASHVREVCSEFDDRVVLREFSTDDPAILRRHGVPRDVFVNGMMVGGDGKLVTREALRAILRQQLQVDCDSQPSC